MKLTRRTFLISSAATAAYLTQLLPSKSKFIDASDGRSLPDVLPEGVYSVTAEMDFCAAPHSGDYIEFFWGPPGAAAINSQFIVALATVPEQTIIGYVGRFSPALEKGQLIIVNNSSQPMKAKVEVMEQKYVIEKENIITIKPQPNPKQYKIDTNKEKQDGN